MFGNYFFPHTPPQNRRSYLLIALALLLMGAAVPLSLMNYGLDSPTPVGAFLNNTLPDATPSGVTAWTTIEAYPNLTFTDPVDLLEVPGTSLFMMAGKKGKLWTFDKHDTTTSIKNEVLDIEDSVYTAGDAGLLGIVFHPEFNQPGSPNRQYFYVYYRYSPDQTRNRPRAYCRLSRFTMNLETMTTSLADEFILIQQYDRHDWHNGGGMFFGNDGFLYLAVGDEGGANDEYNSGQKMDLGLLSGILRIDVDMDPTRSHPIKRQPLNPANPPSGWPGSYSQGYYIPNDNPWPSPDSSHLEEFYAVGLRSPHRMTYDPVTEDIWIGDIGQGRREEVSRLGRGDNAQWPYLEGNLATGQAKPNPLIGTDAPPAFDYPRSMGTCVIGGFVYRGSKYASLYGKYLFGDHTVRKIWYLDIDPNTGQATEQYLATVPAFGQGGKSGISHFATDSTGEIYILKLYGTNLDGGKIYKLRPTASTPEPPALLSQLNIFKNLSTLEPEDFMIPYDLNEPFWSDAALKYRWMILPNDGILNAADEQIQFSANGDWNFPRGAVMVKHFELQVNESQPNTTKRLETRLLVKGDNDEFYGVTYRWRDDQSDAELLEVGRLDTLAIATPHGPREIHWYYPDRQDCMFCHNQGATSVLGPRTRQLNGDITYEQTGRVANQLKTLSHLNAFDVTPDTANLNTYITSAAKDDQSASLELRARTYLDANCGYCHRPSNPIQAYFDARLETPLAQQGLIYGELHSSFGLHDPKVLIPGDQEHSVLYHRLAAVHNQLAMPPLAKNLMDTAGVALVADWLASIDPATPASAIEVVADYTDDFQGPTPTSGWEYLWNSGGPLGNDANYEPMLWNGVYYDSDGSNNGLPDATNLAWGTLRQSSGHPGPSQGQGQATNRAVIAAYTVSESGTYQITNSLISDANVNCGDASEVFVYVNNTLIGRFPYGRAGSTSFDVSLGNLLAGDKIYIAVSPKDANDSCDGFEWDFSIQRTSTQTGQRIYFDPIPKQLTSVSSLNLQASTSSGLPVTYTLISGPASLSGNTLNFTGTEGEIVVRASQPGNGTYTEAPAVERRFWITAPSRAEGTGLRGTYFEDQFMTKAIFDRVDSLVDFYWGSGTPDTRLGYDDYAVVWEGEIEAPVSENFTFTVTTDDGVRLYINHNLIIDNWGDQAATPATGTVSLQAWERVPIRIEYYENRVYASASLQWTSSSIATEVVPSMFLYPAPESSFPVELLSFTGEVKETDGYLYWSTATEVGSSHFELQRSTNGQTNFKTIGRVQAAGNSQSQRDYQFIDPDLAVGSNHYRLKQVDVDGAIQFSPVVELQRVATILSLYPNPVTQGEELSLLADLGRPQTIKITVLGLNGTSITQVAHAYSGGRKLIKLPLTHLPKGTYFLVVQTLETRMIKKIRWQ